MERPIDSYWDRRFKTLHGYLTLGEILGWICILSIILIPFGFQILLQCQTAKVQLETENNASSLFTVGKQFHLRQVEV